jgi:membrane protein implicated in regulation of membrane protease activity
MGMCAVVIAFIKIIAVSIGAMLYLATLVSTLCVTVCFLVIVYIVFSIVHCACKRVSTKPKHFYRRINEDAKRIFRSFWKLFRSF